MKTTFDRNDQQFVEMGTAKIDNIINTLQALPDTRTGSDIGFNLEYQDVLALINSLTDLSMHVSSESFTIFEGDCVPSDYHEAV